MAFEKRAPGPSSAPGAWGQLLENSNMADEVGEGGDFDGSYQRVSYQFWTAQKPFSKERLSKKLQKHMLKLLVKEFG